MNLRRILEQLMKRQISIDEAERKIKLHEIEEIEKIIKYDLGRELRRNVPEIVLAEYKDNEILEKIIHKIVEKSGRIILSRLREEHYKLLDKLSEKYNVKVNRIGRIAVIKRRDYKVNFTGGIVGLITAGTADLPLAIEAKIILEEMGCRVVEIHDVGIASIYRTISAIKKLINENVDVCIVIAGMEGALPSVIASLIDIPVIGLPSSKGYGLGGNGISALLSMLQSCSTGLLVVNIDNSVGAAIAAALIANRIAKFRGMRNG